MPECTDTETDRAIDADLRAERRTTKAQRPPINGEQPVARSVDKQATRMGISRSLIYRLIAAGDLASVRLGGRRLIMDADADALLASKRVRIA